MLSFAPSRASRLLAAECCVCRVARRFNASGGVSVSVSAGPTISPRQVEPVNSRPTGIKNRVLVPGRVIANFGSRMLIEDSKGDHHPCTPMGRKLQISCGDYVNWERPEQSGDGTVFQVSPRYSQFQRADKRGRGVPVTLAANVDQVIAVAAPRPPLNAFIVDRCLASAIDMFTDMQARASILLDDQTQQSESDPGEPPRGTPSKFNRGKHGVAKRARQAADDRLEALTTKFEREAAGELADEDEGGEQDRDRDPDDEDRKTHMRSRRKPPIKTKGIPGLGSSPEVRSTRRLQGESMERDRFGRLKTSLLRTPRGANVRLAGAESAVIVFNKLDVFRQLESQEQDGLRAILEDWRRIGYKVIEVSATTGEGMDELKATLAQPLEDGRHRTSILLGQSGTGKSTLLNALIPGLSIATRELTKHEQGKHTTTAVRLYKLPFGGAIIDSPGIANYSPVAVPAAEVAQAFVEIRETAPLCRFKDCRHDQEPDCAVKQAISDGKISARRHESYLRMLDIMRTYDQIKYK